MVVAEGCCVGIQLGNVRVRKELPVSAPEDAPFMGCHVDVGDLLSGLSSARGEGAEACFDGVGLGGQHRVGHRIINKDAEVCMLRKGVLLGVIDYVRSIRGSSKGLGGLGVCCMEFPN